MQIFSSLTQEGKDAVAILAMHMANKQIVRSVAANLTSTSSTSRQAHTVAETTPKVAPRIIREADEIDISTFDRPIEISSDIITLFELKIYIPIHVFMCTNLRLISERHGDLLKKQMCGKNIKSRPLLDVNNVAFGQESDLSLILWIEAWENYSRFLKTCADTAVYNRWRHHYEILATYEERENIFPVLLAFDIEERRSYNMQAFKHDDRCWQMQLLVKIAKFCNDEMQKRFENKSSRDSTFTPRERTNSGSGSQFALYECDRMHPFSVSKPRPSATGPCIVCGRPGHFARDCSAKTTVTNCPLVVRFNAQHPSSLTNVRDEKLSFCITFNVHRAEKCKPGSHTTSVKHACSICGNDCHHADSLLANPIIPPYCPSDQDVHIDQYLQEEILAGHMSGPFTGEEMEEMCRGVFAACPVHVVITQDEDGKVKCRTITNAPAGVQAATLDIEKAYRTIPIKSADKKILVVAHRDLFWLDHIAPFRLMTSGLQGEVADATIDIWECAGVAPSLKWVDNFNIFHFPISWFIDDLGVPVYDYTYNQDGAKSLIAALQVPWHSLKGQEFAFTVTYVRFLWDIAVKTVQVADHKLLRLRQKLEIFIMTAAGQQVSLKDAQSINGSLNHVAFVYPHGHAFLISLANFIADFSLIPHGWWLNELTVALCIRSLRPCGPRSDMDIWVDASTDWDVGIVIDNTFTAWHWTADWNVGEGQDISWGEAIAVEMAVLQVEALETRDSVVLIHSDNQGVIGAFQRGHSCNWLVNQCIRCVNLVSVAINVSFIFEYVESAVNLADPISCRVGVPEFHPILNIVPLPEALVKSFLDE
ncbi:hypothetical protein EWM64_g2511 [Hericium alpestre]|uniref:CCHC-type domain-containing protein n=1 Tax=Hericium alpestre TaxID=135208 RepID=A0A4Z0A5H5_9AGAM|nr:hypothetical protein EWM64_g2511 [Hericium alpestre]